MESNKERLKELEAELGGSVPGMKPGDILHIEYPWGASVTIKYDHLVQNPDGTSVHISGQRIGGVFDGAHILTPYLRECVLIRTDDDGLDKYNKWVQDRERQRAQQQPMGGMIPSGGVMIDPGMLRGRG